MPATATVTKREFAVDRTGRLDFADLGEALKQSTGLVSLMLTNSEFN